MFDTMEMLAIFNQARRFLILILLLPFLIPVKSHEK
jgi:hypothetical protein